MEDPAPLVFLLDVDNTLLNNDAVKDAIAAQVERRLGPAGAGRFWEIYEEVRHEKGYVDFRTTVSRLAAELGEPEIDQELMRLLTEFPFSTYLYPHALDAVRYLNSLGEAVVLSDGDPEFQPFKIKQSGITDAVEGRVMVVAHKEDELEKLFERYPAGHYVAVDDKPRITAALERVCPTTFTTILVEQGKYARESGYMPKPDITVHQIGDLRHLTREEFLHSHGATS